MSTKLAVILSSGDPKVIEIGLMYTLNAIKNSWMDNIKLYLFGPAEVEIATDPDLRTSVQKVIAEGTIPVACKWGADKYSVSALLAELGCEVDYVGASISRAIRDGYVPLTW